MKTIFTILIFLVTSSVMAHNKVVVIPMGGDAKPLQNIITVAKKNGDFTDPVAAMKSIEAKAAQNNQYLMIIGPGTFSLTETLVMQPYVDITGSGRHATKLVGSISSGNEALSAIVKGADNSSLHSLSIQNTGGSSYSIGVYNDTVSPKISNIIITVSGVNDKYGIYSTSSSLELSDSIIRAESGSNNFSIYNESSTSKLSNVEIIAIDGNSANVGIFNMSSQTNMWNIKTRVSGAGQFNYGILNNNSSKSTMSGLDIDVSGATQGNEGIGNDGSSIDRISGSTIVTSGSGSKAAQGGIITTISNSVLGGTTPGYVFCSFVFDDSYLPHACNP